MQHTMEAPLFPKRQNGTKVFAWKTAETDAEVKHSPLLPSIGPKPCGNGW
jgi:hypothetical protein